MSERLAFTRIAVYAALFILFAASGCCLDRCGGPRSQRCAGYAPTCDEPSCGFEEPICGVAEPSCGCAAGGGCDTCQNCQPGGGIAQSPWDHMRLFWGGCHGCSGCGEVYYDEWLSDPPACCDPCDCRGNWVGARPCPRWFHGWKSLWGHRGCGWQPSPCGDSNCCNSGPGPSGCTACGDPLGQGEVVYDEAPMTQEMAPFESGPMPVPSEPGMNGNRSTLPPSNAAPPRQSPFREEAPVGPTTHSNRTRSVVTKRNGVPIPTTGAHSVMR